MKIFLTLQIIKKLFSGVYKLIKVYLYTKYIKCKFHFYTFLYVRGIKKLPFPKTRAAAKNDYTFPCCQLVGNLSWTPILSVEYLEGKDKSKPKQFVGVCKTCGRRHYVLRVV